MDDDALLRDRSYTTGDLDIALGSHPRSGAARKALLRLEENAVPLYDELASPLLAQADNPSPATNSREAGEKPTWRRFSLPGILWVVLMDRVLSIPGMQIPDLCSVVARFLAREIAHDGSLAEKAGFPATEESRHRYPRFAEYVRRLFEGESEPYLALVSEASAKMGTHERTSKGIPENVVIADNPALVWDLYAQVATRLAGHLHVFPLRSVAVPVLANLRGTGAPLRSLPEVPAYRPPVQPDAKLTKAEQQLVEVVRNAPELVPDVRVRVVNHEIVSVTYEQGYGPKDFSVKKALEDAKTLQVRSLRGEDGSIHKYRVEKRLRFG